MNAFIRIQHPLFPLSWFIALATLSLVGCSEDATGSSPEPEIEPDAGVEATSLTYYRDTKAIIDAKCATCHRDGDIAPFSLSTYDEVAPLAAAMAGAVASGAMPPWQPDNDCNSYHGDFSLTEGERAALMAWLDSGAPAGDPADYAAPAASAATFTADVTLQMPEPYTPPGDRHDDYRCFLIEWPESEPTYITGLEVQPDQRALVHHVIVSAVAPGDAEAFRAMDAAEAGPGYTCFGGPTGDGAATNARPTQVGAWVPGEKSLAFPAGTGIRIEPGSLLVMQMHYHIGHTLPAPDQSGIGLALAAEVERPAVAQLLTSPRWMQPGGMPIPAGNANVTHETEIDIFLALNFLGLADDLGLSPGQGIAIHKTALHMHELGTQGRASVVRASGSEDCLLDIPDWDFHWQGSYTLSQPAHLNPGDRVKLQCWWDNSEANQPLDEHGKPKPPADTEWGEGTGDEMCLVGLFITAQ